MFRFWEANGTAYMVMPLYRGKTLHRDVSPDNIFLQDAGPPVLLDLGAARLALGDNAKPHTAILKVNYAPIEQYADAQDRPQSVREFLGLSTPNRSDPDYAPTQVIGNEDDDAATIIADWAPEKSAPEKEDSAAARQTKLRQTTGRTHVVEDGTTVPRKSKQQAASDAPIASPLPVTASRAAACAGGD